MFRGFFNKRDEEETFYEPADPVVERRRQEKFSSPLLYDEEFNVKEEVKETPTLPKVKQEAKTIQSNKSDYQMYQIISPMHGATNKEKPVSQKVNTPVKRQKRPDNLVPVISPFFGVTGTSNVVHEEHVLEVEEVLGDMTIEIPSLKEEFMTHTNPSSLESTGSSVEENLRNMAIMSQEEQNELKIIEERTGEFRLDLSSHNKPNESKAFIDEVEDDMSLDDLMSLYEKKFTD